LRGRNARQLRFLPTIRAQIPENVVTFGDVDQVRKSCCLLYANAMDKQQVKGTSSFDNPEKSSVRSRHCAGSCTSPDGEV
jgi:hypothetical protein